MPLINCEVSLTLTWSKNWVITDEATQDADPNADPSVPEIRAPGGAIFEIEKTKLYVAVVTLSTEDDNKLLEQVKTGFKRTIKWNKYRPEIINQDKNANLNYSIDPTFSKVNRLFVLPFKNENENENDRVSFKKYYVPNIEIKGYVFVINGKSFFDVPIKKIEETCEKIIRMSKIDNYTTNNLLDYFSNHYN